MDSNDCAQIIKHLNRINGQIDALKGYVEENRSCEDIAHLTKSIITSFSSVRTRIIEEMLARELRLSLDKKQTQKLRSIIDLYKS